MDCNFLFRHKRDSQTQVNHKLVYFIGSVYEILKEILSNLFFYQNNFMILGFALFVIENLLFNDSNENVMTHDNKKLSKIKLNLQLNSMN